MEMENLAAPRVESSNRYLELGRKEGNSLRACLRWERENQGSGEGIRSANVEENRMEKNAKGTIKASKMRRS